jgi:hypothetical protein
VNLNFRVWATFGDFLPQLWDVLRPNLETRHFEEASDRLRAETASRASRLGRLNAAVEARLGESQEFHVRRALDLYHYVNPKLLILTSCVRLALLAKPEELRRQPLGLSLIERGIPRAMPPMEMEAEKPSLRRIRVVFREIRREYALDRISSDYRTLALWPDYLEAFWRGIRSLKRQEGYPRAMEELKTLSRSLAEGLPFPMAFPEPRVERLNQDYDRLLQVTEKFEDVFPSLILNIALAQSEWKNGRDLAMSPFPAARREVA